MSTLHEKLAQLKSFNSQLRGEEEGIEEEAAREGRMPPEKAIQLESIIMRRRRPVLAIQDDTTTLQFQDPSDIAIWKDVLVAAKPKLDRAISAVGRIELRRNPDYAWVGTGWLVHPNVIVTNRHVAAEFAERNGDGFVFQAGLDGDQEADVDFLEEIDRPAERVVRIKRVLHIEPARGIDLAFLEVDTQNGALTSPISLSSAEPGPNSGVAVIGYPAYDSRIPEPDLMEEVYGNVYDKKRLAPGAITDVDEQRVLHNCTTLGGNSGSAVVDLKTGDALGLHFSGSFLRTNYAVRADIVQQRLDALLNGTLAMPEERTRPSRTTRVAVSRPGRQRVTTVSSGSRSMSFPLTVTVSLGDAGAPAVAARRPAIIDPDDDGGEDGGSGDEAKPADYADRKGYRTNFLGAGFEVSLPSIVRNTNDIVTFDGGEHILQYEHFSVVMNRRRRMCFYSACNIDGARSKGTERRTWLYDPRIPKELQIKGECYGNAPKFSRGHMTRREDPAWGTPASRQRGSDDSMHVTNATPQLQSFNSPIWLALEDYALQNARADDMKISVFTGPLFSRNDPTMFGVRIPVRFWKVIAFIHDETGALCATGYEMSQEQNLEEQEFVFGDFVSPHLNQSTQISIASIESRAGISFEGLADIDPIGQEGIDDGGGPLTGFNQIRFF